MSRICPHCNYVRKADDTGPDWQCPACEKAYAKAGGSVPPENFRQYGAASVSQPRGFSGKWLIVLLAFAAAFWFGRPLLQSHGPAAPAAGGEQPEVILYATSWCGYCKATREFFAANGIRYTEFDIEHNSVAADAHRSLGGNGVPLIMVGDQKVDGYNEGALRDLLKPWLKS